MFQISYETCACEHESALLSQFPIGDGGTLWKYI